MRLPLSLLFVLGSAVLSSCAHSPGGNNAQSSEHAYTVPPRAYQSIDPNYLTVAIVAINDFHGNLLPKERKLVDGTVIQSGGASALSQMISVLREEMHGNLLIIDGGDQWQGTLESNLAKGETIVHFYNRLGVNAAAIGNHEFDFTIANMNTRFKEAKYPYVASNILEHKTGRRPNWNDVTPSKMLKVAGIKFGVIGVTTQETPGTTRYEYVKHLDFIDPIKPVNELAQKLRHDGADAVLVTAHAGTICLDQPGLKEWSIWTETSKQAGCDPDNEITKLALGLKPGTLDGIISGHTHQVTHHFYNHIPIVQDEAFNQHFNVIYYTFNKKTKKLITELTQIEGLIPICTKFFENTHHCDVRRLNPTETPKMVDAMFHGVKIVGDPKVEEWLKPIKESTDKYRKQVLGFAEHTLTHSRWKEGSLTNYVTDVLRERAHADFGILNSGGIRSPIDAGPITYDALFRALPFENFLNVITLTGKQLKLMAQIMTSGAHGIIGVSGLKLTIIPYEDEAPSVDLNHDGKLERWEKNRLLRIVQDDGSPIEDEVEYTIATYDYLVNGGDDLRWFMTQLKPEKIRRGFPGYSRDLVVDALKKNSTVNTDEHPLYDPNKPRIIFSEKPE